MMMKTKCFIAHELALILIQKKHSKKMIMVIFRSFESKCINCGFLSEFSRSDEGYPKPNTIDCDLEQYTFAERLIDALKRGATTYSSSSDDSSYAVGISVTGSSKDFEYNVR